MCWTLLTGTLLVGCGTQVPASPPLPRPAPDAAVAERDHLSGRMDIASEFSQLLNAIYRSIYEGRVR